ncbi:hypothetical protein FUA23_03990 [Neolewinella aurantiaca]|uniref:SGNH/GDSL hydrolase family protein n=1 Tax=Neolewinella aurantiaca TaxID=2602767 RepID=A0A5C7FLS3_9BACT|nr:hypothetical protein [Neolewinella aurantiaca]TXF90971.1 hypothetical protein FUA23_03990 [Neolewinella aurantiaca]
MKRFITKLLLFSASSLVALTALSILLIRSDTSTYQELYRYQQEKIAADEKVRTILIGDSSLGNSIDAKLFSELSGQHTLNLALTGLYGYAGSYNVLKAAHRKHPELKNVILVQALDMQTRDVAYAGYLRTMHSFSDFWELSISQKRTIITEMPSYFRSIPLRNRKDIRDVLVEDYIKQAPEPVLSQFSNEISVTDIKSDKNIFLAKIVTYADQNELNLIYLHGPIYEKTLNNSADYIEVANSRIAETGVSPTSLIPLGIKENQKGDTGDHVHPAHKEEFTRSYYDLIADHLKD